MARKKLTKELVDKLRPGAREVKLWDSEAPGFGIRVRPDGAKVYFVSYGTGRRGGARRVVIGRHGAPWTVKKARAEALSLREIARKGGDPATDKAAAKALPTVAEFAERFIEEYVKPYKRPRTASEYESMLRRVILPHLGRKRLDLLGPADVAALHHARRDTPTDANRCLAVLSKLCTWAEQLRLRKPGSNPVRGQSRFRETKRERFLSELELSRLGTALAEAEGGRVCKLSFAEQAAATAAGKLPDPLPTLPVDPFGVVALRLLLLTGCRKGEVLGLRWKDVDLEARTLRVELPKEGKPKVLPLGAPAVELLDRVPKVDGCPYVVAGRKAGSRFVGLQKIWERIRQRAGVEGARVHDLRHSWAAVAAGSGASLPLIGSLLGHSQPSTTQRYAHLSDDPRRAMADTTSGRIAAALARGVEGERAPGEVVPLAAGARRRT